MFGVMRTALGHLTKVGVESIIIVWRRAGARNQHPTLPAGDRAKLARYRLWRRAGRTIVPKIVIGTCKGKRSRLTRMITPQAESLDEINKGFDSDACRVRACTRSRGVLIQMESRPLE